MAEAEPPSTSELLRLITALLVVKNPDATRHSPEDYYLNPAEGSKERTLRETVANPQFLLNPSAAWKEVRYRDWLIARLAANITDKKHDFTAISEPVLYSLDLLGKKYERGAPGVSKAIEAALLTENTKRERTLYSTLTFGISRQRTGTTDVLLLGAGMRRRVELKLNDGEALQCDAEFFVPFMILPNRDHGDEIATSPVRSMNAAILVRNTKQQALWPEKDPELVAMRFNLRIPFKTQTPAEGEDLQTEFGTPEINIQKKLKNTATWQKFDDWKAFLEKYVERQEVKDLLDAPMGPLLGEKISDGAGVTDIILNQDKRKEFKEVPANVKKDLDATLEMLKG